MAQYDIGDSNLISVNFTDKDGTSVDPTLVILRMKPPLSVTVEYTYPGNGQIIKDSTGKYHINYPITLSGVYYGKWAGTGAVVGVEEFSFTVRKPIVT